MSKISINTLQSLKKNQQKICCLTSYDASFTNLLSANGIEVILVGDSLGMVIQGHANTIPVTVSQMVYHTTCAARANQGSLLIADMPFMSYATVDAALANASQLMQAGAQMIKLEGGAWLTKIVEQLVTRGIPVCGHLGLTPQSVHKFGGFKIQARQKSQAEQLMADAQALQYAGAQLLILECIPQNLAADIAKQLSIPVIGIGAGPQVDGQILVLYDMLGISAGKNFKFCKNFLAEVNSTDIEQAIVAYRDQVKNGVFPVAEHSFD